MPSEASWLDGRIDRLNKDSPETAADNKIHYWYSCGYPAHIPAAVNKKILCRVEVGRQDVATVPVRTICGDLVFPDRMVINKTDI